MEFNELILKRRSVRSFSPERVPDNDTLKKLICAAIEAPSWKNSQTGRYYCVTSPELLKRFLTECLPEFNAQNAKNAALIVTTFVKNRSGFTRDGKEENECGNGWGYYDLGLQNENLVLQAADMGLKTLIMGIRNEKAIRDMLDIRNDEQIVSVIAVGYSDAAPERPKRKSPEDVLRFY